MTALLLLVLTACSRPAQPPVHCPDGTQLVEVEPLQGLATAWCARKNGAKHGPWRQWRLDGTPYAEGAYHNNRRSGRFVWWHANGQLREEAHYHEGRLEGERTTWDEQGRKVKVERYAQGKRVHGAPEDPSEEAASAPAVHEP